MNEADIDQLNKIISERENQFHHALSDALDSHELFHLKNDLDFLKEKRRELYEKAKQQVHVRR